MFQRKYPSALRKTSGSSPGLRGMARDERPARLQGAAAA
jgi:hypothetical protein